MFRFTIRDVLWLTVVVALIAVWRTDLARQRSAFSDLLVKRAVDDVATVGEMNSLVKKAKGDPQLSAELRSLSKSTIQYVQQKRSLN